MTHVFVHGNPEVDAIWGPLVAALTARGIADIVLLSPPGFGSPAPDGWDASMESYANWLIAEVEKLEAPVHLVGHDWGAGHVLGLLARRPDLVATWATDIVGLIHPDYTWHDAAQAWQTPDVGEQVIDAMVSMTIDERTAAFAGLGLPDDILGKVAAGLNAEMGRCILGLYRDATQPAAAQLGERLVNVDLPRGLGIIATADSYVPAELCIAATSTLGAAELRLEGLGHWWMVEDPDRAAVGLINFWQEST